jgi:hypothetical protein
MPPKPKTKQQAKKRIATRSRKTSDTSRSDPHSTQVEGEARDTSLRECRPKGEQNVRGVLHVPVKISSSDYSSIISSLEDIKNNTQIMNNKLREIENILIKNK